MIIVIADDLTGAAEIGGIAWRHGLSAEIQVEIDLSSPADLLVVDTNSRGLSPLAATERVVAVAEICRRAGVTHLFKKVDSVLRGPILAELYALMGVLGRERGLLVPANPGLGRTVGQGIYRVQGDPLDRTDFANDPDYPATSADVRHLLWQRSAGWPHEGWHEGSVQLLATGQALTTLGVSVGEAESDEDVQRWADALDGETLPAGASAFFAAYLTTLGHGEVDRRLAEVYAQSTLYVNGSTAATSHIFIGRCKEAGTPVLHLLPQFFDTPAHENADPLQAWADAIIHKLAQHPQVIVTLAGPIRRDADLSQGLTDYLGMLVERILAVHPVDHLLIEGGATAAAIIQRMKWQRLAVIHEAAVGVVSVKPILPHAAQLLPRITMKPGSYAWPSHLISPDLRHPPESPLDR